MTKIIKPTTKEQLIYFMVNTISLGTYDRKFLVNVNETDKQMTTNQADLLDKIILRYHKQFAKHNINSAEMVNLPWSREPILSTTAYTHTHVSVDQDSIIIRSPYKREYVDALKKNKISIVWNKEDRLWKTVYCEQTLKYVLEQTEKYYTNINYCDTIKNVINEFIEYEDCLYWDPTLVYKNKYYIAGINELLNNAIKEDIDNIDYSTIARLVSYGISIDKTVDEQLIKTIGEDERSIKYLEFSKDLNPILDIFNLDEVIDYLQCIKTEAVLIPNSGTSDKKSIKKSLLDKLSKSNIKVILEIKDKPIELPNTFYVTIIFGLWNMKYQYNSSSSKTIFLADSKPIELNR
jgi:hypothetical protein